MTKYIKNRETLCHKCLSDSQDIKSYNTYGRGYGSDYDNCNETVQLCPSCRNGIEDNLNKWFNEICDYNDYCQEYEYEDKITDFINNLPIQGKEIVVNQTSSGACSEYCDSQDWIDIELNIADDEIYKRNGMYSPSEIKAYNERFPTCKNVYLKVWNDGSSGTRCKIYSGVFGTKDFQCSGNICNQCYYCDDYEKKDEYFIPYIEKQLSVMSKIVEMHELFCPHCGYKILKYRHQLEDGDLLYCDKCYKELVFKFEEVNK